MHKVLVLTRDEARNVNEGTIVLRIGAGLRAREETYVYVAEVDGQVYYRHENASGKDVRELIGDAA